MFAGYGHESVALGGPARVVAVGEVMACACFSLEKFNRWGKDPLDDVPLQTASTLPPRHGNEKALREMFQQSKTTLLVLRQSLIDGSRSSSRNG